MPLRSKAQQRLAYASLSGKSTKMPKKVAKELIEATPKVRFKKLKERIKGNK